VLVDEEASGATAEMELPERSAAAAVRGDPGSAKGTSDRRGRARSWKAPGGGCAPCARWDGKAGIISYLRCFRDADSCARGGRYATRPMLGLTSWALAET
jgi:hypothetical protein